MYSPFLATSLLATLVSVTASSLIVSEAPDYVRPYIIPHYATANAVAVGQQIYRFPVTNSSSGGAFSVISTASPDSDSLGVLPHLHTIYHENFFCFKGRFQLWAESDGDQEARLLTAGDFGAVPQNTTHTYQILDPDTEMLGVIQPGGFEYLFFALASSNYSSITDSPFVPSSSTNAAGAGSSASEISALEAFDVYAELDFSPRRDLINGTAPASDWHTDSNTLAPNSSTPFFIASGYGPKYLNSQEGYQIVQPFITPTQSAGDFTQGTITIGHLLSNITATVHVFEDHVALETLTGALTLMIDNEEVTMLDGDVAFIPAGTPFQYWSNAAFTKFLYVCGGAKGLDTYLLGNAIAWDYSVFPTYA